jgi:hypothetical protein
MSRHVLVGVRKELGCFGCTFSIISDGVDDDTNEVAARLLGGDNLDGVGFGAELIRPSLFISLEGPGYEKNNLILVFLVSGGLDHLGFEERYFNNNYQE